LESKPFGFPHHDINWPLGKRAYHSHAKITCSIVVQSTSQIIAFSSPISCSTVSRRASGASLFPVTSKSRRQENTTQSGPKKEEHTQEDPIVSVRHQCPLVSAKHLPTTNEIAHIIPDSPEQIV
jgi:hypothetical protein